MIYFISGHRDITQEEFDANYVPAIEDAIDNGQTTWEDCEFIVGDCKGCDQMAAEYIAKYIEENMDDWDCVPCTLTIHHMFSEPRFRVGTKADDGNYYIDVRERFNEGVENGFSREVTFYERNGIKTMYILKETLIQNVLNL